MVVAPEPMSNGAKISNYISHGGNDLENNCSGENKSVVDENHNSCNTLQKLSANTSLRIIVGQLNTKIIVSCGFGQIYWRNT